MKKKKTKCLRCDGAGYVLSRSSAGIPNICDICLGTGYAMRPYVVKKKGL